MGLCGGPTRWVPFERDRAAFLAFPGMVAVELGAAKPDEDARCEWCRYRGQRTV